MFISKSKRPSVLTIFGFIFLLTGIVCLVMMVIHAKSVSWKDIDRLFYAFKFLFFTFAAYYISAIFFFFDARRKQKKNTELFEKQNQLLSDLLNKTNSSAE